MNFLDRFSKNPHIKLQENPSGGILVVPCGQTDRQTDMTKLTITFRDFANAPKTGEAWEPTEICVCVTSFYDIHTVKWIVQT